MSEKQKLIGKFFYSHYTLGENVLDGWEAKPLTDTSFEITRHNGTKTQVSLGQTVQSHTGPQVVGKDKNGNINVGDYTVIVGEGLIRSWDAKKIGTEQENRYLIRRPQQASVEVEIGGYHKELGRIGLDKYGHISTELGAVKQLKKDFEFNLIVFDKMERGGFLAYFNVIDADQKTASGNGTRGVIYPAERQGQPMKFSEEGVGGTMFTTATFWPTKNTRFSSARLRSLEDAIHEKEMLRVVTDLESKASMAKIEPTYLPGYDDAKESLLELNKEKWSSYLFTVQKGERFINPNLAQEKDANRKTPSYSLDSSPSP